MNLQVSFWEVVNVSADFDFHLWPQNCCVFRLMSMGLVSFSFCLFAFFYLQTFEIHQSEIIEFKNLNTDYNIMMTLENTSLMFVCLFFGWFIFIINFYHNLSSKYYFPDVSLNLQKEACFKNLGDIMINFIYF